MPSATIDGLAVVLCPKTGLSLFDELHSGRRDRDVILYALDLIDLLELNGKDQRSLPLEERKAGLADLFTPAVDGIELSEHIEVRLPNDLRLGAKMDNYDRRPFYIDDDAPLPGEVVNLGDVDSVEEANVNSVEIFRWVDSLRESMRKLIYEFGVTIVMSMWCEGYERFMHWTPRPSICVYRCFHGRTFAPPRLR